MVPLNACFIQQEEKLPLKDRRGEFEGVKDPLMMRCERSEQTLSKITWSKWVFVGIAYYNAI